MSVAKDDAVCAYVHDICGCATHGGRVCRATRETVVVMDIPGWTDEMSACVRHRFPGACISVRAASESLTGFNVIIELPRPSYVSVTGVLCCIATFSMCAGMWWVVLLAPSG
jgi:hypothetical protein